jgi:hypothetical protein
MDNNEVVKHDHRQAELLRLDMGMEGCGCADCQELYRSIDLDNYGARVQRFQDIIIILPGASRVTKSRAPQDSPEPQPAVEKAAAIVLPQTDIFGNVTLCLMKLPYRPHSQSTIFDHEIEDEISAGKSLRAIVKSLSAKGYKISHMTIKRRRDAREKAAANA